MMTDPISDMLTRIRNAQMGEKVRVRIPASALKLAVAKVLQQEGYIADINEMAEDGKPMIEIGLKYFEGRPVIDHIARSSRPGRRNYVSKDDLPRVAGGLGVAIVSTSKGVMTDRAARSAGLGGEVLCVVS